MYPLSFKEYGLSPELLSGLADVRIEQPTPLQNKVLPAALQGKHLLVKTEAEDDGTFLIPALQKIAKNGEATGTQVLILTPTIERATKIDELVWAIGYHAQISSALLAMKGNKTEQEKAVLDGAPVIVANPGRLIEILEKNSFQLPNLKLIVIDEAHNMENFDLVNRVKEILRFVDGEPQTLILSSRHNNATKELAKAALNNPELIGFNLANGETVSTNGEVVSEPIKVDLEEAEKKLDKASIKVVLNPDPKVVAKPQEVDEEEQNREPEIIDVDKEKPEEVTVEEALNSEETNMPQAEIAVDLEKAEEKLKKSTIKVVLKKDIEEKEEEPIENTRDVLSKEENSKPISADLEQGFIQVPSRMKISTLMAHLDNSNASKVMIFTASKRTTDRLFHIIKKKKWGVISISAGVDEATYSERFAKFTSGEMRICLVGGIPANEVEIEAVQEVINYDVPSEIEEYRYRAELVGNGKASRIISLVSKMDEEDIARISKEVGYAPNELPLPEEIVEKKNKPKNAKAQPKSPKKSKAKEPVKKSVSVKTKSKTTGRSNKQNSRTSAKKSHKRVSKKKEKGLPRPTYDGLSGGRDGDAKSGGVFGWVKKLFD